MSVFARRITASLKVENNFQVHHMYNALQPLLEDAERLVVACQQCILSTIPGGKATMRGDTCLICWT